jgi:hypothetical protein
MKARFVKRKTDGRPTAATAHSKVKSTWARLAELIVYVVDYAADFPELTIAAAVRMAAIMLLGLALPCQAMSSAVP